MLNIGPQELILILVIALLVVGPAKLPDLAKSIGRGLRELRRAQDEVRKTVEVSLDPDDPAPPRRAATGAPPTSSAAEPAASSGDGAVTDVSRTLGRGLAELRRAREEVQRTFRVDLGEASPTASPTPPPDAAASPKDPPAESDGEGSPA